MKSLSLTMIVKNEEKYLSRCLNSVKGIVDEIIVVDTGSTDNTKEIAESFGARIYDFSWINDFSAARNFAIGKSTGDYNLILDADEYVINDCRDAVRNFIENNHAIGRIQRKDSFIRDGELQCSKTYLSRLAPKFTFYVGRIHEQVSGDLPRMNVGMDVCHDGYLESGKAERNLGILLLEAEKDPENPYLLYQIANTLFVSNQKNEAQNYFEKFYRRTPVDTNYRYTGVVSYLYNIIALKKFEEGLQIIENEKCNLAELPDFHFVCGVFYMELVLSDVKRYIQYLPLIEKEYLVCLRIGETGKYDSVIGTGSFCAAYNLGAFYEVSGNIPKALEYYEIASGWGYEKAKNRLVGLTHSGK
jgi:glycosyltransferase involved in cell wall biosynthesis